MSPGQRSGSSNKDAESPSHKPGTSNVVLERMIAERLILATESGLTADKDILKSIMTQIASDGRRTWASGAP